MLKSIRARPFMRMGGVRPAAAGAVRGGGGAGHAEK